MYYENLKNLTRPFNLINLQIPIAVSSSPEDSCCFQKRVNEPLGTESRHTLSMKRLCELWLLT